MDGSDKDKNDEKIDVKEEPRQAAPQNQNNFEFDDSDDNEEAVEVRMGQDSASRTNYSQSAERENLQNNF